MRDGNMENPLWHVACEAFECPHRCHLPKEKIGLWSVLAMLPMCHERQGNIATGLMWGFREESRYAIRPRMMYGNLQGELSEPEAANGDAPVAVPPHTKEL
jgi:hypothetical protein